MAQVIMESVIMANVIIARELWQMLNWALSHLLRSLGTAQKQLLLLSPVEYFYVM